MWVLFSSVCFFKTQSKDFCFSSFEIQNWPVHWQHIKLFITVYYEQWPASATQQRGRRWPLCDDRYAMLYILKLPLNPVLRSHQDLSFIGYCPTFYVIYIMHRLSAKKMKTSGKTKTKNNIYDFTGIKTSRKGHFFLLNL